MNMKAAPGGEVQILLCILGTAAQSPLAGWIFVSLFPIHLRIVVVAEVQRGPASVLKLMVVVLDQEHILFLDLPL